MNSNRERIKDFSCTPLDMFVKDVVNFLCNGRVLYTWKHITVFPEGIYILCSLGRCNGNGHHTLTCSRAGFLFHYGESATCSQRSV